ncbi:MAG: winged helix-turn-helix transcriptional regulator [Candidatus Diapherotrites archaeon]|uniref:Winged helix-turn-helix transcriptional regulator n=1 Tax=Candidatus Iainarchaeum sp. TaxID=3101447 RepID=A0A8T4KRQ6_9ARCH|nr:winged helix-turn-helix transcriptional regulator [Candidatus Diapherotrites archaeon]
MIKSVRCREDRIHIWDFPNNTTILITDSFLQRLIRKRKQQFRSWRSLNTQLYISTPFSFFKSYLKPSYKEFRPLPILLSLCKIFNIGLQDLQKNILAYHTKKSRIIITNPNLPIVVTPLFSMIVAHIMADGCLIKFNNKKTVYFNYTQYNKQLRKLFIAKVEKVFGNIKYPEVYYNDGIRVYLPEVISLVMMKYYGIGCEGFLENKAKIPDKTLNANKDNLLTTLIAFIIDEGNVDSGQIVIGLHNKSLIEQLSEICNKLQYKNTISSRKPKGYVLYILKEGMQKFWRDYSLLKKKFPEICMGYKENSLRNNILRMNKTWKSKGKNHTKNKIIGLLNGRPRTIKELSELLTISRQGTKFHLKQLKTAGIISTRSTAKYGGDVYYLDKYYKLNESKKGQSRQLGVTKVKIMKILNKTPNTTLELAKKLNMGRNTVYRLLKNYASNRKIICIGNRSATTHPTKIWSLKNIE